MATTLTTNYGLDKIDDQSENLNISRAKISKNFIDIDQYLYNLVDPTHTATNNSTLSKIKEVDGDGSGLDADLLDGLHATDFVRGITLGLNKPKVQSEVDESVYFGYYDIASTLWKNALKLNNNGIKYFHSDGTEVTVWTSATDGSGSGLDADKLKGLDSNTASIANTVVLRNASKDIYCNILHGTATSANYADVAERYKADKVYAKGTVLGLGGNNEVTEYKSGMKLAGVVSTAPGFMLNNPEKLSKQDQELNPFVALKGRVPCLLNGDAKKGQYIIADDNGRAKAVDSIDFISMLLLIGIALNDSNENVVEVKI